MNGIRHGSRLEQLLDLRRQVNLQIELETRENPTEAARLGLTKPGGVAPKTPRHPNIVNRRLDQLGITSADVKAWAFREGIIPAIKQGRIGIALLEQYAAAHAH